MEGGAEAPHPGGGGGGRDDMILNHFTFPKESATLLLSRAFAEVI